MTVRNPLLEGEYKRLYKQGLRTMFAPVAAKRSLEGRTHSWTRQESLANFVRAAWPVIEPMTPLVWGPHLDAICEHLQAVADGQIRNLIINIPPRFSKSTTVAVAWPCHVWTYKPEAKMLFSSYGSDLSERDSLKCKRLLASPFYRSRYGKDAPGGERFHILKDKDTVQKFENNYGGYRMATSVGGVTTGEGADILVVDDPLKARDADSDTARAAANNWWSETMASRLNNLKTGAKVIIMQRLHEEDLTGYVLATEAGYELLCMPMEYEVPRTVQGVELPKPTTSIGWQDWRSYEGQLLCPERAGTEEIEQLKRETTPYAWAGQYQQRPAPRGGGMFQRKWFPIVPASEVPRGVIRLRGWDRAATQGGGAYTAGVRWAWAQERGPSGALTNVFYIEHVERGQWATEEREAVIRQSAMTDGRGVGVAIEREGGSSGIDSANSTVRMLPGFVVRPVRPTGSKEVRAEPMQVQAAAGAIRLVQGEWNNAFLQEASTFPMGRYRDQIDAASLGFNELVKLVRQTGWAVGGGPRPGFAAPSTHSIGVKAR